MSNDCENNGAGFCQKSTDFTWIVPEKKCNLKLMCTELNGYVCGDYGLASITSTGYTEICYRNFIYDLGTLSSGEEVTMDIWKAKAKIVDSKCLIWCNTNNNLIKATSDTSAEKVLLQKMVKYICFIYYAGIYYKCYFISFQVSGVTTKTISNSNSGQMPISPMSLYHYNISKNEDSQHFNCDNGFCWLNYTNQLLSADSCSGKFFCTNLGGNSSNLFSLYLFHLCQLHF